MPAIPQERLWKLSTAGLHSPYYNVALAWQVRGKVETAVLELALNDLLGRHEVLRSCFCDVAGEPKVALREGRLQLMEVTLKGRTAIDRRTLAWQRAPADLQKPWELGDERLLRALLYRYGETESLLVLHVHQILVDGSSLPLIAADLRDCYRARVHKSSVAAPRPPVQYYDFAFWQRQVLAQRLLTEEEHFWDGELAEPYTPMMLGNMAMEFCAMPGPARVCAFELPATVSLRLTQLAGEAHTTLFSALLTAFQCYLHLLTGSRDIIVFSTVACRHQPELRKLVGLIANVLPFRTRFPAPTTFAQMLQRVGATASAVQANSLLPMHEVLKRVRTAGARGAGGLFQALFIYQNGGIPGFSVDQTDFVPVDDFDNETGRFAIHLELHQTANGLKGRFKYRLDLLGPGFGEKSADLFVELLRGWAEAPHESFVGVSAGRHREVQLLNRLGQRRSHMGGANGKQERVDLRASKWPGAGKGHDSAAKPAGIQKDGDRTPLDSLERSLLKTWESVLKQSPVHLHDNFFHLGGDSLMGVQLMLAIKELTGQDLPLATLFFAPTVKDLARTLRQGSTQNPWKTLVRIKPGGRRRPLYLVHGVGGNALGFHHLARRLADDQPVYGLQSLGLDGQEAPLTRIEDMAAHYVKAIREFQPKGPYALGGLSFGGMVAYEMAQQLVAQGESVSLLALFDTYPPEGREGVPARERYGREAKFLLARVRHHTGQMFHLSWPEKLDYVRGRVKTLKRRVKSTLWQSAYRLRSRKAEEQVSAFRDVKEANWLARSRYRYQPYPGRVTLFQAMEVGLRWERDPVPVWTQFALGGLMAIPVPGNHLTLIQEPHVVALARQLQKCLDHPAS